LYNWEDADSDNDGFSDGYEKANGFNHLSALSHPEVIEGVDSDGDGILDLTEKARGATIDTDEDGSFDWEDADSDNDGFSDGEEIQIGTDPYDKYSKPLIQGLDHLDISILDDVIEFLSFGDLSGLFVKADLAGGADGGPDGQLGPEDLEELNKIIADLRDVNGDGWLSWDDVYRIEQMIEGEPNGELRLTEDQINRANVDGIDNVDTRDVNLIKAIYERLRKGDIDKNGIIGDDVYRWDEGAGRLVPHAQGNGVADDIDYMKAVIYYRNLLNIYEITTD
ncbi:unnamed protein product, partial [marine sediment metagenome]